MYLWWTFCLERNANCFSTDHQSITLIGFWIICFWMGAPMGVVCTHPHICLITVLCCGTVILAVNVAFFTSGVQLWWILEPCLSTLFGFFSPCLYLISIYVWRVENINKIKLFDIIFCSKVRLCDSKCCCFHVLAFKAAGWMNGGLPPPAGIVSQPSPTWPVPASFTMATSISAHHCRALTVSMETILTVLKLCTYTFFFFFSRFDILKPVCIKSLDLISFYCLKE